MTTQSAGSKPWPDELAQDPLRWVFSRIFQPSADQKEEARRREDAKFVFDNLRRRENESRNWEREQNLSIIPGQAQELSKIFNSNANQELARSLALQSGQAAQTGNLVRQAGSVKESLARTMGSESRALQGVVNDGRIGEVREAGEQSRGLQGVVNEGRIGEVRETGEQSRGLLRTATEGDLAKIAAGRSILELAQRQEQVMGDRAYGFGNAAFASQRAMLGDVLAHRAAMESASRGSGLGRFLKDLAPIALPIAMGYALIKG